MSGRRGKILVIRGGAIGDFILTLPAIAALRARFARAHLELLGYPHIAQLAVAAGLVDRVRPIEAGGLARFFARGGELADELKNYFSEFDVIVSYLYDPDQIFCENVGRCFFGLFIQGPHRPCDADKTHASALFLKPLERLAIFDADTVPRLRLAHAVKHPVPTLALHPGSGSERKNWPEAKWRELVAQLLGRRGLRLLLVGGEAEGDRLSRLAETGPAERIMVARSLPLVELGELLQGCIGFVGHDSGITHLAAALGLPCIVLWGQTAPEVWRPQGEKITLIHSQQDLAAIPVNAVLGGLSEILV